LTSLPRHYRRLQKRSPPANINLSFFSFFLFKLREKTP
jgi:hypothetical protein